MTQKYDKLKNLLKELFQLDQPDLDFGLYRVMHARCAEVTQFLDKDLLPQVKAACGEYKTADKAEIEMELARVIAGIEAAGMDPAQSPKVSDLRDYAFRLRPNDEKKLMRVHFRQLEDFQKKLWLKKKFVVETSWCIRVGCIPEGSNSRIWRLDL